MVWLYWIGVKSVISVVLRKSPRGLTFGEQKILASDNGGDGKEETNSYDGSVVVGNGLTRISSQSMSEEKSSLPEKSVFVLSHGENG